MFFNFYKINRQTLWTCCQKLEKEKDEISTRSPLFYVCTFSVPLVQEIREVAEKPPGDGWLVSILLTVMDKDTKTNVSSTMTTDATFPHLRDKVRAYATLMGGSSGKGPVPMDIDQIG